MSAQIAKRVTPMNRLLSLTMMAGALLPLAPAWAAAPGITTNTGTAGSFTLTAQEAFLNQPDGNQVYSWGYGCTANSTPAFSPTLPNQTCSTMQVPGPTLIVTESTTQPVTVTLTNNLPAPAGNTSILFPDFSVKTNCGAGAPAGVQQGLLTCEAAHGSTVTYTFMPTTPGTHAYYSGTQGDLQIDMGLYGAIIVLPANPPAVCGSLGVSSSAISGLPVTNPGGNSKARAFWGEAEFRNAAAAYDHPGTCYDREYLFQFAEMDLNIHRTALAQVTALAGCTKTSPGGPGGCSLQVPTEPWHPNYFVINGRSMPDDMDPNFDGVYPHQPYNGNPHMHLSEQVLVRVIGQGRWQHPFHEHGNHVRILARDGNLITSNSTITYAGTTTPVPALAGRLEFTTDTTPGQAFDGIFYFSGRGLNWDPFGHNPGSSDPAANLACTPDANGYNTAAPTAINYYEWCQDHNKPLQVAPFGDVPGGGPATLPDPNIFTNGAWYGGTPYFGPDATLRGGNPACASTTNANCALLQPANTQANPANERGWAFMWHSHNEREITTNNVFPGGMLMMMLVDSREFVIDESN
jgi:FtsP/CotA-like multicopper oxidase with cupredoxin domain